MNNEQWKWFIIHCIHSSSITLHYYRKPKRIQIIIIIIIIKCIYLCKRFNYHTKYDNIAFNDQCCAYVCVCVSGQRADGPLQLVQTLLFYLVFVQIKMSENLFFLGNKQKSCVTFDLHAHITSRPTKILGVILSFKVISLKIVLMFKEKVSI